MYLHALSDEYFLIFRHMGRSQSTQTRQRIREMKVKKSQTGICEMLMSRYVINSSVLACSDSTSVSSRSCKEVARFISGRTPGNACTIVWGSSFACHCLANTAQGRSHYEKGMHSITGAPANLVDFIDHTCCS